MAAAVMQPDLAAIVTEEDLERELTFLQSAAAGESAGIFGPESVFWRVNREGAVFLGAGRALALQLAHPWVAAAVDAHSEALSDPIGRFQRTFSIVLTMTFGTTTQAISAARRLHRRHTEISGTLTEAASNFAAGSTYHANDVAALRWVWATLVGTSPLAYELVLPPLSAGEYENYYAQARLFAGLFGIPQSALPQSWAEFGEYFDEILKSDVLVVSDTARRIASRLFCGGTGWPVPSWYCALTARLLPPRLRQDFGLAYGVPEQRSAERALAVLRHLYPRIPAPLRFVAPYHEARSRIAGQKRPGALTRLLNRLWIGHTSMNRGNAEATHYCNKNLI